MNEAKHFDTASQKAIADIIDAISLEQAALNSILETEKDMLQKAFGQCSNMFEFISVNDSVNGVVKNIVRLQTLTQLKLEDANDLLKRTIELDAEVDDDIAGSEDDEADIERDDEDPEEE